MSVQSSEECGTHAGMANAKDICSIKGCGRPAFAKGLCEPMYRRQVRDPKLTAEELAAPVRENRGELAEVNTRVPAHVRAALEAAGGCYSVGAAVLQAWADGLPMPARPTRRRKAA